MKKFLILLLIPVFMQCTQEKTVELPNITAEGIESTVAALTEKYPNADSGLLEKGVKHVASLWRTSDGDEAEFKAFCLDQFISTEDEKELVFEKISANLESLYGHFNEISLAMQKNLHLSNGPLHEIDKMFAAYSASSHLKNDFYSNKIAIVIALNFPPFSLEEKSAMGPSWDSKKWAYVRLGDVFSARVPAELLQNASAMETNADIYISQYNIYMGKLVSEQSQKLFPDEMVLLTHWNLRDEIKANYANKENGKEKQEMVYAVMKRIIDQTIPRKVINSDKYEWNPVTNELMESGQKIDFQMEETDRYQQIINNFKALQAIDKFHPELNTYIKRKFSGEMEIPQEEVEKLFDEYLSSPVLQEVGALISKRLGRELRPYDIWYDGFKARSSINQDELNEITRSRYKTAEHLEQDLDILLRKLGWSRSRAEFIASKIDVDPARGSGHAWGAQMKSQKAHLRTRVPETGMDYKGYNIAIHEFGHNVEQTISLQDVDYYMLNGVPNTSFTEALAFIFQKRDLELLGINDPNPDKDYLQTLDNCWSLFEIMGVSMVDMKVWKWLYANPDATAAQLKEAVLTISKEVWNKYHSKVFGSQDETILAVYSHMIAYPLYLSAYSFGHLIDFQIEQHLKGKNFSDEVDRIWKQGRLTPDVWMKKAVGSSISNEPILTETKKALDYFKN